MTQFSAVLVSTPDSRNKHILSTNWDITVFPITIFSLELMLFSNYFSLLIFFIAYFDGN